MRTALRLATEALRKGRTARSVREALEAELVGRLERTESTLLTTVVRQIGLARDIAVGIREALAEPERRQQSAIASAARAQRIEKKADGIAVEARGTIRRSQASSTIARLVDTAEDAIDELEQAAFFASLVPSKLAPAVQDPLAGLCDAAVAGTEARQGLEAAPRCRRRQHRQCRCARGHGPSHRPRACRRQRRAGGDNRRVQDGGDGRRFVGARACARLGAGHRPLSALGHLLHDHVMADLSGSGR